jgi:hypothetical protein
MRIRVSATRAMTATGAAAVSAVLALGITGAIASVTSHGSGRLFQCGMNLPRCGTPLLYRPAHVNLALQAKANHVNARVIIAESDDGQVLQDWTYKIVGSLSGLAAGPRRSLGVTAYDSKAYAGAWLVRLELTPMGSHTGLCAANVSNKLVLQRCDGSAAETFIQTPNVGAIRAIIGFFGLSMVQAPHVTAHHLAATGSYRVGTQVTFQTPASADIQYWFELFRQPTHRPTPTFTFTQIP